jgi:1-acyl-sn-glycerol-3-phosphate acyltransferase
MLQDGRRRPGGAALVVTRAALLSGQTLEAVGQVRLHTRGVPEAARRRIQATQLRRACVQVCRQHGFDVHVEGQLPTGPAVLVANHLSYIDPLVLGTLAPICPVAKGEVARWPVIGSGARSLGVLFVRRGDVASGALALRGALRALDAGVSVLGFPEGTTSAGEDVLPFRRGLFGVARIASVPVVPIAVRYPSPELCWVGDTWFLPHYLRTAMRDRTAVVLQIGAAIRPTPEASAVELAEAARASIRSMIGPLRRETP